MAEEEPYGREEVHTSTHRLWLALSAGALIAAVGIASLETWWPAFQVGDLPTLCAFRRISGTPCPGCGLTRSWTALGRGGLTESLGFHRLGWATMLFVAFQALRHAAWLVMTRSRPVIDRCGRWLDRSLLLLVVAMFVNWGFVLAGR